MYYSKFFLQQFIYINIYYSTINIYYKYIPPSPSISEFTKSSFSFSCDHAQAFFSVLQYKFYKNIDMCIYIKI